jgi:hypothetical protein
MFTESLLLSFSALASLTGGILISKFLARRLPDLLRSLRPAKTTLPFAERKALLEQSALEHKTTDTIKMQEMWGQKTTREIEALLPSDWSYCFGPVSVPDGSGGGAWCLRLIEKGGALTESEMREIGDLTLENISKWAESHPRKTGSPISEELLEKLRSVKGQIFFNRLPVFYEEYCNAWLGLPGPNPDDNEGFDRILDQLSKTYEEPKEQ